MSSDFLLEYLTFFNKNCNLKMGSIKASDLDTSDELYLHRTILVDKGQKAVRIDKYLMDRLDDVSRNRIQNAIKIGCILVNDKEIKSNYKIKPHDEISLVLPSDPNETTTAEPQNIPLHIVYEDDDILVIDKAAGMVVHPGVGNPDGTLVNALLYYFKDKEEDLPILDGNNAKRAGLVHRIDKETSGLMLIAKNDDAMTKLAKQFFDHTIDREYVALVWGSPEPPSGTIEGNITRHVNDRLQMTVTDDPDEGKHAITHYELLEDMYYVSLVKCKLETGRTHQIRVHMKYIGCTLFNDERYGGHQILKGTVFSKYKQFVQNCFDICPRQALHARTLGFVHPTTKKKMFFESPLPEDIENLLEKWRGYHQSRKELV